MAKSFGDYIADAGSLPEEAFLGALVMYSFPGARKANLTHKRFDMIFTKHMLNPGFVPSEPTEAQAFANATGGKAPKHSYSIGGKNYTAEVKAVGSDRDTITRVVWTFETVVIDGKPKQLKGREVGRIVFYKSRDPKVTAPRVRFTIDDDACPQATEERVALDAYMAHLHDDFKWYANFLYDQPIRQSIMNYVERGLNGISTLTSGGCYFVHRSRWDELHRLADAVAELHEGFSMTLCPIPNLPDIKQSLIEAFQNEAEQSVTQLVVKIQERRKSSRVTAEMVQGFGAEVQQIAARAEEHSRILDVGQDRTANALEIAYAALAGLAGQIGVE